MDANLPIENYQAAHFDGRQFHNEGGVTNHGFGGVLRWMITRKRGVWPRYVASDPAPPPAARVQDGITVTLIGHATVLLQFAGLNIITDPMFSDRAGPTPWLGVKRVRPPAIAIDDLPKIDFILLSHNHYDHLDRPSLATLARRDQSHIVTGLKVGKSVPSDRITELDWWLHHNLRPDVRATYVPARHFSARTPFDRNQSLWGGFVLETPAGTIYFAGDSGDGPHFAAIRQKFGPITLSLLPIGAYAPRWFMAPVHMDPAQAVAAAITLESRVTLPIHYGAFPLADDGFDDPLNELAVAKAAAPNVDFRTAAFGEAIKIKP